MNSEHARSPKIVTGLRIDPREFEDDETDVGQFSARPWKSRLPRPGEMSSAPQNSQKPSNGTHQAPQSKS